MVSTMPTPVTLATVTGAHLLSRPQSTGHQRPCHPELTAAPICLEMRSEPPGEWRQAKEHAGLMTFATSACSQTAPLIQDTNPPRQTRHGGDRDDAYPSAVGAPDHPGDRLRQAPER
jgi:hypothetical protein